MAFGDQKAQVEDSSNSTTTADYGGVFTPSADDLNVASYFTGAASIPSLPSGYTEAGKATNSGAGADEGVTWFQLVIVSTDDNISVGDVAPQAAMLILAVYEGAFDSSPLDQKLDVDKAATNSDPEDTTLSSATSQADELMIGTVCSRQGVDREGLDASNRLGTATPTSAMSDGGFVAIGAKSVYQNHQLLTGTGTVGISRENGLGATLIITFATFKKAAAAPAGTDLIRWAGFAAPTVAGEQDYTIPGIGTPTGVLIFMSDVDSLDTDGGQGRYTVGLSDMTDARTVCITDWNTQPTTVSQRGTAGERVGGDWLIIDFNNNDTGILSSAFLVGTITDGIRVDWTDPAPKAQRIMVCFFLNGVSCKVIDFANSGSGDPHTFALTGIGFKPDTMFLTSIRTNATTFPDPGTAVVEQALTLGIAHDDGGAAPFPNFSVNVFNKDNAAITRTGGDFDSLHCLSNITGQVASDRKFEVTSFDSDGVTIEVSGTANATVSRHMALFIKWPAGAKTDLRSIDTRTTVGNLDIDVGFAAQSGILIGSDHTAVNTHEIEGKAFGISLGGFADDGASIENFCLTLAVRDGVTTSSNRTRATETDALENYVHTGALSYEADVSLLTSPNVRLNFTIVNSPARKVIMLSVAPAAGIEIFRRLIEGYK